MNDLALFRAQGIGRLGAKRLDAKERKALATLTTQPNEGWVDGKAAYRRLTKGAKEGAAQTITNELRGFGLAELKLKLLGEIA